MALVCCLAGLGVGTVVTWNLLRSPRLSVIPDETAILTVLPPRFEEIPPDASGGIDALWRRQIKDHVVRLGTRQLLRSVLKDNDIESTDWYAEHADPDTRLGDLENGLQVEHLSESSLILVHFEGASTSDARTIANTVVRRHIESAEREALREHSDRTEELTLAIYRLARQMEEIRVELLRIDDPDRAENLELELASVRARQLEMQRELEEHASRRYKLPSPLKIVQVASDPAALGAPSFGMKYRVEKEPMDRLVALSADSRLYGGAIFEAAGRGAREAAFVYTTVTDDPSKVLIILYDPTPDPGQLSMQIRLGFLWQGSIPSDGTPITHCDLDEVQADYVLENGLPDALVNALVQSANASGWLPAPATGQPLVNVQAGEHFPTARETPD